MSYDEIIFEAIRGATHEHPLDLVGILRHFDGKMKLVLSYDELVGGLQRLLGQGRIIEAERHAFYAAIRPVGPSDFGGLTLSEYRRACESYRASLWREYRALDHPPAA